MSRRRQGRELALGCLYAYFATGEETETIFAGQAKRASRDAATEAYAKRLFTAVVDHADEIDRTIRDLAAKWDFARIGMVEKNVLRLAIAELRYCLETPAKVVINEAVDLAREYAGEESHAFVNGILDRVYKLELAGQGGAAPPANDGSPADPR